MPTYNKDAYDISRAFGRIENELLGSMMRNMERHRAEERDYGFDWPQWQALQLQELRRYREENKEKFREDFDNINSQVESALRMAYESGQSDQEAVILDQIRRGKLEANRSFDADFFRLNNRRIDSLVEATTNDIKTAEQAILRMANDKYRQIVFDAQVYFASGAGTYEKAVDMAAHDMLMAGLNCIEYKNGARHTAADYAEMVIRTSGQRAYLRGEGQKRNEWGVHTVIVNKRGNPCPKCAPWCGKVMIDDVYAGATASEAKESGYPRVSTAMRAGFLHPRCKDTYTTHFPGVSQKPKPWTKEELASLDENARLEAQLKHDEKMAEKCDRVSEFSLDQGKKKSYAKRRQAYRKRQSERKKDNEKQLIRNINYEGTDSVLRAQERRRIEYGLNWVPYDETNWDRLRDYPIVDYTGVSVETAEVFNKTLSELSEEYLSGITGIRVANPKEIPGATFFAQTQHHDQLSMNELLINPVKCRDKEKMVERIRALSDKGYCVMLPPGMEEQYIAVHEFAHGLLGLKESRKSLVGMDWKKTNRTRREIKAMYEEYMEEIRSIQAEIAELKKSPVLIDLNADPADQMEAFRKLQDAQNRLKTVKISDYSMESADEFMAEAFTQHRIGVGQNKYTDRVMEVLDREYRLDKLMKPVDKPAKAAKAGKRKSKKADVPDVKAEDTFIPAETIEEAQEYAQKFVESRFIAKTFKGQVVFKGISVDHANEINQALTEVFEQFPELEKLSGIKTISPTSATGKKAFKDGADALFSYDPVQNGIFINKNVLKNAKSFEAYRKRSEEAWDLVMSNLDRLSGAQRELAEKYAAAGRSLVDGDTVKGLFTHELGHHVQWTMLDPKTTNSLTSRMMQYAPKISGYAQASGSEYLAESFTAYMKGERYVLDPEYVKHLNKKLKGGNVIAKVAELEHVKTFKAVHEDLVYYTMLEEYDPWVSMLSEDEIIAIKKYTENLSEETWPKFYAKLNAMLRGDAPYNENLQRYADLISGALRKKPLENDILCVRRSNHNPFAGCSVDESVTIRQFFSSSLFAEAALSGEYEFTLLIHKGVKGAFLDSRVSMHPEQLEFLIDRDCEYILTFAANTDDKCL